MEIGDVGGDGTAVDESEDINPDLELTFAPTLNLFPQQRIWTEVDPKLDDEDDDDQDDDQDDDDQDDDDQDDDDQDDDDQDDDDQDDDKDDDDVGEKKPVERSGAVDVHSRYRPNWKYWKIICRTKETGSHIIQLMKWVLIFSKKLK